MNGIIFSQNNYIKPFTNLDPGAGNPQGTVGQQADKSIFEGVLNGSKLLQSFDTNNLTSTDPLNLNTNEESLLAQVTALIKIILLGIINNEPNIQPQAVDQGLAAPVQLTQNTPTNTTSEKPAKTTGKLEQAVQIVRNYLQNKGDNKLLSELDGGKLNLQEAQLQSNILGMQQGDDITISSNVVDNTSAEDIAGILLHELNHFSKHSNTNSLAEEREGEMLREDLLDSVGKGEYTEESELQQITASVKVRYDSFLD